MSLANKLIMETLKEFGGKSFATSRKMQMESVRHVSYDEDPGYESEDEMLTKLRSAKPLPEKRDTHKDRLRADLKRRLRDSDARIEDDMDSDLDYQLATDSKLEQAIGKLTIASRMESNSRTRRKIEMAIESILEASGKLPVHDEEEYEIDYPTRRVSDKTALRDLRSAKPLPEKRDTHKDRLRADLKRRLRDSDARIEDDMDSDLDYQLATDSRRRYR